MANDKKAINAAAELRRKAEEKVASQPLTGATMEELYAKRLLHELQVHQTELEMQNEELLRALSELSEHKTHLENVIKMTPAGYFHIDLEGRFIDVNDAWLRMHGYNSPDEIIGKHFSMMQVDSESDSALVHLAELKRGVPIPYGEFSSRRKDGSVGHHIFSAHPVVHVGNIVGFEWFIIDISERKRLEEEKELLQQQFQQAQKLESLGVLASGIAHDFNNILAVITGNCFLAKLDLDKSEHHLDEIEKASQRAAALCRQMLAYAGKGQLVQAPTNFVELVDDAVKMLRSTLPQNAVIKMNSSPDIPFILGDAAQLNQIAMNLIINAAEAIGEEQGEILLSFAKAEVKAEQRLKDRLGNIIPAGEYVCLDVTDNGCGMDEETKWRIFEPFYTTKFSGRGLGMSAVLGIITAHKGALQLYSELGEGTIFKVYLPTISTKVGSQTEITPSALWQGTGTILLVEDEEQIRKMAIVMLQRLGFAVIEASNGKEALELYQQKSADITLVVTDIGMPIMDGYELIRKLKKINPTLPIIISSGFGDVDITARIAKEDIAGLINKPYTPNQLREVLKRVIESIYRE